MAVFFSLSYWNALFSPYLTGIFQRFEKLTFKSTLTGLSVFSFLVLLLFIKKPRTSIQSIPYAIFTTGLAGMIFNLSILFTFQTCYGYVYHEIGILVAIFMAGIAPGSLFMTGRLNRKPTRIAPLYRNRIGNHSLFPSPPVGVFRFSSSSTIGDGAL